jgi:pyroglutamyl-peptidase
MKKSILLTAFTPWKPHHISNSSDDLLELLSCQHHQQLHLLRKLPVDFQIAPGKVLARFNELKPEILICCGMAEERKKLSIESRATLKERAVETSVDLKALTKGLTMTEISNDAGQFVCNTLYYKALNHLDRRNHHCIFVHIPVLTAHNVRQISREFRCILDRLSIDQGIHENRVSVSK